MKNAYRSFSKYESNLKNFLDQSAALEKFEVRIYTDDTGKDIALNAGKDYPAVSVILFDCPEFREESGHVGTFGTLVRFLPLFEDLDIVWSSDIDIPDSYLDTPLLEFKTEFWINTVACYERKVWGRKYTILAGRFVSRMRFPKALLTRYLNNILSGELDFKIEEINNQNKRKFPSRIPYGIDELFLNTVVYKYLQLHAKSVLIQKDYSADTLVEHFVSKKEKDLLHSYYSNPTKSGFLKVKEIYQDHTEQLLEKYPCLQETYDKLPSFKNSFVQTSIISGSEL